MTTTTTKRTLAHLRDLGYTAQVVERFNPHVPPHGVRQDLFGFIDVLAIHETHGILGVQTCARSRYAAHAARIRDEARALTWLRSGARLEVWSWRKRGAAGRRKTWDLQRHLALLADGGLAFVQTTAEVEPGPMYRRTKALNPARQGEVDGTL